jgi:hypothetical protein
MEPGTADIPVAIAIAAGPGRDERLVVASRLSSGLARAHSVEDVATIAVNQLHVSFDYYLAVVQRLDPDGSLRVVAGAGPLAEEVDDFLALEQPVEVGQIEQDAFADEDLLLAHIVAGQVGWAIYRC